MLFSGDTLFPGGPGNTELRGRRLRHDHRARSTDGCSPLAGRHDRPARPRRRHDHRHRAPAPRGVGRSRLVTCRPRRATDRSADDRPTTTRRYHTADLAAHPDPRPQHRRPRHGSRRPSASAATSRRRHRPDPPDRRTSAGSARGCCGGPDRPDRQGRRPLHRGARRRPHRPASASAWSRTAPATAPGPMRGRPPVDRTAGIDLTRVTTAAPGRRLPARSTWLAYPLGIDTASAVHSTDVTTPHSSRSTTCRSSADDAPILKGVDLTVPRRRGPRPHGPQRLGQVHAGQHAARQPRVRGHHRRRSCFKGDDITDWSTDVRGKAGMFLAFQYPQEIPGVSVINFLRQALSARKGIDLSVLELRVGDHGVDGALDMDPTFADRYLNEGFSGGEKKRNEILQMAILEPELAILDETDSGLDIDALQGRGPGSAGGPQGPTRPRRAGHHPLPAAARPPRSPTSCTSSSTAASSTRRHGAGRTTRARGLRGIPVTDHRSALDVAGHQGRLPDPRSRDRRQPPRLPRLGHHVAEAAVGARRDDRLLRDHQRQRAPRRLPDRRRGHRGAWRRPGPRWPTSSAPPTAARSCSPRTPPRRSTSWPRHGAAPTSDAGDVVVLTEIEHHANIVPWHMLAAETGHRAALDPGSTTTVSST